MTLKELCAGLREIGFEVAYHHFAEGKKLSMPYIAYKVAGENVFYADGVRYKEWLQVDIELYTKEKDLEAERKIEDWLDMNGIFYETDETFIESEDAYRVLYEVEI